MECYDHKAHNRLDKLEASHIELERMIIENTKLTQTIANNTSELVELVKGVKGVRRLLLWGAPILAAVYSFIQWFKHG